MKNIFKFLKFYSTKPLKVDKLIISAFLVMNDLKVVKNELILTYLIQKDNEDYTTLLSFVEIIKSELKNFSLENLIELFEFVISPQDKIINGAIYTPADVRKYIVEQSFNKAGLSLSSVKIADISCGCSGFLFTVAQELKLLTGSSYYSIFKNQIFGLDIEEYSIKRSKLLLTLLALSNGEDVKVFHFNFYVGDALVFQWKDHISNFSGFEVIVGNPPYVRVRNLNSKVKSHLLNWSVAKSGNTDLYIPFFQIGFENLSSNGILGFITMNTFFKSLNGRALREYFKKNSVTIKIIDFGTYQIFKSRSTYTCICFIEKDKSDHLKYFKSDSKVFPTNNDYISINYSMLDSQRGWNLKDNNIINTIEATGTPFGNLYKTRHGIATLRNDIYIFKPIKSDDDFYYLQNGKIFPIEKSICKDVLNSNKLSKPVNIEHIKEKIIFPYTDTKKPKAIEENILKIKYPETYKYLLAKKSELACRDKGKGKYETWFAFGRSQSLEQIENKLFFPKFSDKTPNYIISSNKNLLFYNGLAIIGLNHKEMLLIKKIMESRLFWYYIKTTSKPYSSNYYSLNGNYIRNFGIYPFSETEKQYILDEENKEALNRFIEKKYKVQINI